MRIIDNDNTNSLPLGGLERAPVVGILGAGSMGSGIAQIAATEQRQVVLVDVNETVLQNAKIKLEKILNRLEEKGKLVAKEVLSRIQFSESISDFENCGMVIEDQKE